MRIRTTVALAAMALLSGCAGTAVATGQQRAEARAAAYVAAHPALDAETGAAIRALELRRGMTMEQVVAAWGEPAVVQRFRDGKLQSWYFGCDWPHACATPDKSSEPDQRYISRATFIDGKLTVWQD